MSVANGQKSNYLAAAMIGHVIGKSTFTAPTDFYLALTTIAPLPSDTGSTITEVAYTSYARLHLTAASFTAVTANAVSNSAALTFVTPGATGATANGWALCDAASAGNVLYSGPLAALVIVSGIAPSIPAGYFVLGES